MKTINHKEYRFGEFLIAIKMGPAVIDNIISKIGVDGHIKEGEANQGKNLLIAAARLRELEMVKYLISKGADVNYQYKIKSLAKCYESEPDLHVPIGSSKGNVESAFLEAIDNSDIVFTLLEAGADPRKIMVFENVSIYSTLKNSEKDMIESMLKLIKFNRKNQSNSQIERRTKCRL